MLTAKVPALSVKFPLIAIFPVSVLVPAPLIVRLLKVLELILLAPELLKVTVLEFGVKVPLFVQLPLTDKVFDPAIVSEAAELIVMFLQTADALIIG